MTRVDPHGYGNNSNRLGELLLMRHPQTEANLTRRYLGQRNAPLSALGDEQCRQAIEAIVRYRPDRLVSSPLERCLAIAVPAAKRLGLEVEVDDDVMEMGFGVLENLTYAEAVSKGLSFPERRRPRLACRGC